MGRAAPCGDDRQWLAQRLRLLPGFGAGLRRSLPRRDRTSRSHRAGFIEESARMSCPGLAQGACARRRLCLRAREIAAERGRGGACQACAASPIARLARYVAAGGLRPFRGKPCVGFGRWPPCALSGPERQSKARHLAAPLALLAPRGLWGCARPPGTARLPHAFACARLHLPPGDRASRLRRLRSVAPGTFEACPAAHSGCRASALHHPRAALPRGQYARPAHRRARAPRLSGGEARHQADPGGGRRRDGLGSA